MPIEALHQHNPPSGLTPHLKLTVGCVVMLLRGFLRLPLQWHWPIGEADPQPKDISGNNYNG
eukprot:6174075-Pleurochrysis_carterae.AAC.2